MPKPTARLGDTLALARTVDGLHAEAEAVLELGLLRVAEGRDGDARSLLAEAIARARQMGARPELAKACLAMSEVLERTGYPAGALTHHKEYHAVGAAELASSGKHAAAAAKLWLDFQDASRRAALYSQRAQSLEADHAALSREAEAALAASQQDPLTGLLNRLGFDGRVAAVLADCRARAQPETVVVIDVDHFKAINDGFSHAAGDAVLHEVAETIRAHCRQQDLPVRWGGDEFVPSLGSIRTSIRLASVPCSTPSPCRPASSPFQTGSTTSATRTPPAWNRPRCCSARQGRGRVRGSR